MSGPETSIVSSWSGTDDKDENCVGRYLGSSFKGRGESAKRKTDGFIYASWQHHVQGVVIPHVCFFFLFFFCVCSA